MPCWQCRVFSIDGPIIFKKTAIAQKEHRVDLLRKRIGKILWVILRISGLYDSTYSVWSTDFGRLEVDSKFLKSVCEDNFLSDLCPLISSFTNWIDPLVEQLVSIASSGVLFLLRVMSVLKSAKISDLEKLFRCIQYLCIFLQYRWRLICVESIFVKL